MEATTFRRICVYTGSNRGARGVYTEHAWCLGQLLARRGIGLVYGGGRVGLMGIVADAVLQAGGEVIGVIPEALVAKEIAHPSLSDLRVVGSMHERKALMSDLSDAFVALPGGFGTFEELFEIITWSQLGILTKPVGLLNSEGFYDPLIALVEHGVREGFIHERHASLITATADPTDLLDALARWRPPPIVAKWLSKSQT